MAQITSDRIYLLLLSLRAPDLMTLQSRGHASLMYFWSGTGVPLHKLVTAQAPVLIICLFLVF